ncbi:hypothetical protein BN1058_00117 [Paraliobacillus sp. PM-2]|uniref:HGGxSTG domain-containing protein n=1 Tax=Paraliobacillus sp. PM-2 TaxID=1462524 RepID=UPI00061CB0CB|nr:HGGxSTG domain-containing protein [Paraliobacillus sp. PM-2]CQR45877.1 hypothetical protein BN1058_00117 [Paraliobacillus sp. PM-2]
MEQKGICGARKKKSKEPCRNRPLENGRCRFHGGLSRGPIDKEKHRKSLEGNKNAIKTGEYETISYDTLTEDEKVLFEMVPEDVEKQVKGRYKLLEIRTRRLMKRYNEEFLKAKPNYKFIDRLEEALTRIDSRAYELIRENREFSANESEGDTSSLDNLVYIISKAREQRQKS